MTATYTGRVIEAWEELILDLIFRGQGSLFVGIEGEWHGLSESLGGGTLGLWGGG